MGVNFSEIGNLTSSIGNMLTGIGTLLLGITAVSAIRKYTTSKMSGKLNNVVIEHDAIRIRELNENDCDRIVEIVRNFSENTTACLYEQYLKNREAIANDMRNNELPELLKRFTSFDEQLDAKITGTERIARFREEIKTYSDEALFCPYGMLQAPFQKNAAIYINRAITKSHEHPRDEFRMGVEYNNHFIGCFVFDFIPKTVSNYQTIGDTGMFGEPVMLTHPNAIYYPAMYFFDRIFPASLKKKKTYIGVTLHPCDYVRPPFFSPEYGFKYVDNVPFPYNNGSRNRFIAKYTDFIGSIFSMGEKRGLPKIITNSIVRTRVNTFTFFQKIKREKFPQI